MKRAFTLIEVNLAMLIMAGGILSMVGLYAFGFRENRQGREDVKSAAFADAVISPLVMAMSATNVTWNSFKREFYFPNENGWAAYFDDDGIVTDDPKRQADNAYSRVKDWLGYNEEMPTYDSSESRSKMTYGIVIMHPRDSATASICFRAAPQGGYGQLLAMPMYFTVVRFQGTVE